MSEKLKDIDPEILAALRNQVRDEVLQELNTREAQEKERQRLEQEKDAEARKTYVERMKNSSSPWVEIVGASESNGKIKIDLDWNDAFVLELRRNGFVGESDDAVVQHYVAILAKDVAEDMGTDNLVNEIEGE